MTRIFLQRTIRLYLAAGIAVNVCMLCLMMLMNYKTNLERLRESFAGISGNISEMYGTMEAMDRVVQVVDGLYPYGETLDRRDALLLAADTIKSMVPSAGIALQEIVRDGDELILPIEISMATASYKDLVRVISSMQSLIFPYSVLGSMEVVREGMVRIRCTIKATLNMPADSIIASQDDGGAPPP